MSRIVWSAKAGALTTPPLIEGETLQLGDRITWTEIRKGRYAEVMAYALARPRGTTATFAVEGDTEKAWIVEEATVTKEKPGLGVLTITWSRLAGPPPSTYSMVPFEITPQLARHPQFSSLPAEDIDAVEQYVRIPDIRLTTSMASTINQRSNKMLMWRLIDKRRRGQETYYLAGLKYLLTWYSYTAPSLTLGGFRQTPTHPTGGTWPAGMSWLRIADESSYDNGIFKTTNAWLGGPGGFWDTDIYP